jgi:hypothetical protein
MAVTVLSSDGFGATVFVRDLSGRAIVTFSQNTGFSQYHSRIGTACSRIGSSSAVYRWRLSRRPAMVLSPISWIWTRRSSAVRRTLAVAAARRRGEPDRGARTTPVPPRASLSATSTLFAVRRG